MSSMTLKESQVFFFFQPKSQLDTGFKLYIYCTVYFAGHKSYV